MSEAQVTRRRRQESAVAEAAATETAIIDPTNGANDIENAEGNGASVRTDTIEFTISDNKDDPKLPVAVPRKFYVGYMLVNNQDRILDTAYQRQYINNVNANLKARRERLAKAISEGDTQGILENQPLTAEKIVSDYTVYEPSVGGGPRMSTIERMRHDAAWRVWIEDVGAHNAAVLAWSLAKSKGSAEPFVSPVKALTSLGAQTFKPASIPAAKTKKETKEEFETRRDEAQEKRNAHTTRLLEMNRYAARIQAMIDLMRVEKGADKDDEEVAPQAAPDLSDDD